MKELKNKQFDEHGCVMYAPLSHPRANQSIPFSSGPVMLTVCALALLTRSLSTPLDKVAWNLPT